MREIVLASASPRRTELLKQVGTKFRVIPSDIDEIFDVDLNPEEVVQELSYQKALAVARNLNNGALVIGADTIVVKEAILGKPRNDEDAYRMLKSLQGEWHSVITGVSIIDSSNLKSMKGYEKTLVKMKPLSDQTIRAYINTGEHKDKAGSYAIQGMGALLVEKIEGCYFNIVGLPLAKLDEMLQNFDVYLLR